MANNKKSKGLKGDSSMTVKQKVCFAILFVVCVAVMVGLMMLTVNGWGNEALFHSVIKVVIIALWLWLSVRWLSRLWH